MYSPTSLCDVCVGAWGELYKKKEERDEHFSFRLMSAVVYAWSLAPYMSCFGLYLSMAKLEVV